ncbi:MAG: ABC transporter ATP-binding protein [Candidatus Micrarchaeaceae archaeon]
MINKLRSIREKEANLNSQLQKLIVSADELNAAIRYVDSVKQEYILQTINTIKKTINDALSIVFGPEFKFDLVLDTSGKKSKIVPQIEKPEGTFTVSNLGGGLTEFISLLIRISLVILYKRKLLILDEPFRFLDKKKKRLVLDLLLNLDIQLIMVTHDLELIQEYKDRGQLKIISIGG